MAYIQDSQYRLTLHTAQALGVSSLASGEYGYHSSFAVNDKLRTAKIDLWISKNDTDRTAGFKI